MSRLYGWSKRGARSVVHAPFRRGENTSVITAMGIDGVVAWQPWTGAIDGERFIEFIATKLAPKLRPGSVVVLDNVRFHHNAEVRRIVEERGGSLAFIPPYHPELNAAEELFSFAKTRLRRLQARNLCDLIDGLRRAFSEVGYARLRGFILHALRLAAQSM